MRKIGPLDALLPKTRQGILAAMLVRPEKAWYVSELARHMRVPPSSLQRDLHDMTVAGILQSHRQGRMVYYQANRNSPIYPDLRSLFLKTAGLVDVLADALESLRSRLQMVWVYGSIAEGTEASESDIDLLVVGSVPPSELSLPLRRARDLLGRDINPTLYTSAEFKKKRAAKDPFLTRVLDSPRLVVLDNGNELGQAAKRSTRGTSAAE
jgi:predicted nucleotidyltransferase